MPDPIVAADALPADSSPASAVATSDAADPLDRLSASELATWRTTGNLPSTSPVTDAAAASSTAVPAAPVASTDAHVQAASEPAAPTPGADKRIPELLRDRAREREGRERAEARIRELEARSPQPAPDARPAASSPAPAGLVEPDPETFAYGTADPAYVKAVAKYEAAAFVAAERATYDEGQRQTRAREESQRVIASFEEKAAAARVKHPDFDVVAMLAPTDIQPGSIADLVILEDEAGAEILYHLQQPANAAERKRLLALGPREQFKALVLLGDRLIAPDAAPRTTNAPPPPPTVGTRATPADPVERALALGTSDEATGAYNRAANARDLARRKGL